MCLILVFQMVYLEINSKENKMQYFSLNIQATDNFWTNKTEIDEDVFLLVNGYSDIKGWYGPKLMYALRISSCWLTGYSQIWGRLLGSLIKMSNVDSSKRLLTDQRKFFVNWSTLRLLNHNFNITHWSWFTRLWVINIFFFKKRINSSYFVHGST